VVAAGGLVACSVGGSHPHATAPPSGATPGAPVALTVDGLAAPLGLATGDIAFAWHVDDARRGAMQSAYRIVVVRVAPTVGAAGPTTPVWDSGRVSSPADAFVAYRGPALAADAVYRWQVQTWDAAGRSGPLSAPGSFETGLSDRDWRADWIRRTTDTKAEPNQYTYVRKEVVLRASPIVRARVYVSGDQQYELSVNGARAGKGEAYSYPDTQYYETLDVTKLLRPGVANAFGLLYSWDGPTKGHPAGAPGAIAQISILHRDGQVETVTTDGSWRVRKGAWMPGTQRDLEGDLVDYTENIDGRAMPPGWDEPGFDDTSWTPATVVGPAGVSPWTHLVSVRTRIVEEPVHAVSLTRLASGAIVADFGKVYAAIPTVTFHHGVAGRLVTMRAGFVLDEPPAGSSQLVGEVGEPGQVSKAHGTQHTDMSYSYIERGGVETFRPFDYLGFRYFQIDDPGETLTATDVVAYTRHTAVPDEHAATFSSSDPTINAVFELGRHSSLFTAQEQFIDTPTREKGSWLWDGFNDSTTAMSAFGEQNLTRKSLLEFAQSQGRYWPNGAVNKIYPTGLGALDINEFAEIYPEWVWQYWMNTGDKALLAQVYPVLVRLAGYVRHSVVPATHLVTNLPSTSIYYTFPTVTRLNILGVNVFRRVGAIATVLGRPQSEIATQVDRATSLVNAINARLRRPDGIYVDGLAADGAPTPTAAQDANAAALDFGIVPVADRAAVAAYVGGTTLTAPPRTASEVLDALALAGRDGDLVRILDDKTHDGWANVLARGGTFTWEVWEPSDVIGDSMSHGWGSDVLVSIQQSLLGVTADAAGYAHFVVAPPAVGLTRASGTVPTPQGTITVAWRRASAGVPVDAITVTVPPNSTATVDLHAIAETAVTDAGTPLAHDPGVLAVTTTDGTTQIRLGAGTYHLRTR
jgi:alpha-L-rhamnosidase